MTHKERQLRRWMVVHFRFRLSDGLEIIITERDCQRSYNLKFQIFTVSNFLNAKLCCCSLFPVIVSCIPFVCLAVDKTNRDIGLSFGNVLHVVIS